MSISMLAWAMFAMFPQDGAAALKAAIDAAGAKHEPIVTPDDKALIAHKCGYATWDGKDISLNDGVLICKNGRRVADAETRALEVRISKRARAYANAVMGDPEVKRAINLVAKQATKEVMVKVKFD